MSNRFSSYGTLICLALASCNATPNKPEPKDEDFVKTDSGASIHQDVARLPLIIVVHQEAAKWAPIVEQAINEWNENLGFQAFLYVGLSSSAIPPMPGIIPVVIDEKQRNQANTLFSAEIKTGKISLCMIIMPAGQYSRRVATLLAMHELGHALGLGHDDDLPKSLMHPILTAINVAITDHDIEILRARYNTDEADTTRTSSTSSTSTPPIPPKGKVK